MIISAIGSFSESMQLPALNNKPKMDEGLDFSSWIQKEVSVANQQILDADLKLREYAVGETDNLHQVMTSISKAKTSFELVVEVRSRLLEGYQEIMRMAI